MASLYEAQQQRAAGQRTTDPTLIAAAQIHDAATKGYDRIRNDATLSPAGKQAQMAPVYRRAAQQLADLDAKSQAQVKARKTELTRAAFGVPSDPIAAMSYRDAIGRAEQIDQPRAAADRLNRALDTGDNLMAQAIAQHAAEQGWHDVLGAYTAAKPTAGDALTKLGQLQSQQQDLGNQLQRAAYFRVPKPTELDRMHDWQIESLANQGTGQ